MTAPISRPQAAPKPLGERAVMNRIDPSLLSATEGGKPADAVFFLKATNPDKGVRSAFGSLGAAEAMPLGAERKKVAFDALNKIGHATIDKMLPTLDQLQKDGKVSGVDTLYAMNAVRVRGASLDTIKSLVGGNVRQVVADVAIAPDMPNGYTDPIKGAASVAKAGKTADPSTVFIDWGTKKMDAPAAWKQGITGAGIVIGSLDTGVITDHPGLKRNYRGTKPDGSQDHNYNLWNGIEKGAQYPIDDVGHGTHTLGNAAGYDANHLIGVAPDAKYVAGRGLGAKGGSLFSLMGGMDWMMAPTDLAGQNPRPDLAPDIVTNSWGGAPTSNPFLWAALRNWRRAGIVPVFASGNDRNASPGRVAAPGLYGDTITVGATEKDDSRAWFSMYGPSNYATDRKPEVVAPGTKIYSALPDGTFRDTFIIDGKEYPASGTSMATPHVAGAVALYMQAHPNAGYDEILGALKKSGTSYKTPNDEIGYGRVAVDKLIAPGSIDKKAQLTDPKRVAELMDQVERAQVFGETPSAK